MKTPDRMTADELKKRFPSISGDVLRLSARDNDTGVSSKPKSVGGQKVEKIRRSEAVGKVDRECFVEAVFHAGHGQELDEDNRRYILKPILDAIVNLGFSKTDKKFKGEVTQRMDATKIHF